MSQDASHVDNGNWLGISGREACKEIAYGSVAGMVAEVLEYPFDLAKVRLQAQQFHFPKEGPSPAFKGPWHCLNQTWSEEGVRGLYRGLSVPLVGSMAQTAGLFLAYASFQHAIQNHYHGTRRSEGQRKPPLTIPQLTLAAAGAGFVTSFILTPMELVKCRLQVQMMNIHTQIPRKYSTPSTATKLFSFPTRPTAPTTTQPTQIAKSSIHNLTTARSPSPLSPLTFPLPNTHASLVSPPGPTAIVRSIYRSHGFKGFWLGQTGMIFRETGGSAVWFAAKEIVASGLRKRRHHQTQTEKNSHDIDILPWESAISGAAAGGSATLLLYPADTVKSAIQTEEELRRSSPGSKAARPTTFWRAAIKIYRAHGFRGFYAGCGMTVARSAPSSGIIFVVYDGLQQWFG
ncbi:hypothetical protein NP233_g1303 [Leucocoprinus birnbaumii]|uniref:Mitochondrial carrier n=1 Tax=Leucocoprinus birnbaumii TaxID=56174 RepID=A0AAD5W0S0_9AGAR|nr:hypothetical protein NP233_g1303 [Leucocoprinus birnbaumii]